MYTRRRPGLSLFKNYLPGRSARFSRSDLGSPCKFGGSYPPNYARCRSGEKSTKIHEGGNRTTRKSLGCTRLSRRTNPSHVRAHRGLSCSARREREGGALAGCNGKAGAPGLEMTKGKKLYTKSTCIVRDECGQIHLRPGSIKHGNRGGKTYTHFIQIDV